MSSTTSNIPETLPTTDVAAAVNDNVNDTIDANAVTAYVPNVITVTDVGTVDEVHDLLNRFSGQYTRDSNNDLVVNDNPIASQTINRIVEILSLTEEQATLFLVGLADHKIQQTDTSRTLTYDLGKLV